MSFCGVIGLDAAGLGDCEPEGCMSSADVLLRVTVAVTEREFELSLDTEDPRIVPGVARLGMAVLVASSVAFIKKTSERMNLESIRSSIDRKKEG
jgi:hypothetical protein